jgi:hypothetical protein
MCSELAPYLDPTAFVAVTVVTACCALLLAAEALALWRVVRRAAGVPRWARGLAIGATLAAVWSGGLAVAGYLAYRFFRDSPTYTAAGYDVCRAIQASEVLARMEALALGTVVVMCVLVVLGFVALAAPRGSTVA